ncbi:hypothetical protein VPH35_035537 [Triticum aestivum]
MPGLVNFFLCLIREDGRRRRFAARGHHEVGGRRRLHRALHRLRRVGRQGHQAAGRGPRRGLRAPGHGHRAAARCDHAPTVAGSAQAGDGIPGPALTAPTRTPPPPPAPVDEPGFFVFVPFPNGAGGTTQAAGPTPVAQPGDADAGPCRSAAGPPRVSASVPDEAPPSPRTVARPHRQDSASMEGRRRLFGRAIAAIDRRPSRRSGLAPDLPNGAAAGAIDVSSPRKMEARQRAAREQRRMRRRHPGVDLVRRIGGSLP